tara:strand:- start:516 stop:800 length:285 start_codon:yes stop_codon:yes gene_type:complete
MTNTEKKKRLTDKLSFLKQKRILKIEKDFDLEIKGFDHLIEFRKDNKAYIIDDTIDYVIRNAIIKYNHKIEKINRMKITDFKPEERVEANNAFS